MKKILLGLLGICCFGAVCAQNDTLVSSGEVRLRQGGSRGELLLEVGGYGVTLGQGGFSRSFRGAETGRLEKPVRLSIGFGRMELGFSLLTTPNYAGYAPETGDFLDQRVGKSTHFGFRFFNIRVAVNRQRNLFFQTGLHLMCDNYTFAENITLQKIDGQIMPVALEENYRKSKLMNASLGVPLQLSFSPVKKLWISGLVYGDVVFNSHTKYKKPKYKDNLSGINIWQCGVGATISYRGFGVYFKYGISTMFRSGIGPKVHPITVGLYLGH